MLAASRPPRRAVRPVPAAKPDSYLQDRHAAHGAHECPRAGGSWELQVPSAGRASWLRARGAGNNIHLGKLVPASEHWCCNVQAEPGQN
eukprot:CAMPEP_0170420178 /NCGR_PEP_ID=MMETSP0117_2-20130122/35202_1 /TAXON_ID=400756 /ORGANISM="Durinskia baltica, Strain CSIRO CS-38" /LENGTH=88 /DNA_ID=CAMNT_0010678595 /DNA_START=173 /DNA_END=436 /DNA_ORIENTATION=-